MTGSANTDLVLYLIKNEGYIQYGWLL